MNRNSVVVIGSLNYDNIFKLPARPQMGETMPVDSASVCCGGKGANQAVQCAKLGMKTYMVGAVGDDYMGKFLVDGLREYGVDTTYVKVVEGTSGFAVVNSMKDGSVFATIVRGANYAITCEDIDQVDHLFDQAKIVILQLEIPVPVVEYIIKKANAHGCQVLLNAAPAEQISFESIKACDTFIANEVEAGFYTGRTIKTPKDAMPAIEEYARKTGRRCIFTLGKHGAVVHDGKEARFVPAVDAVAVETTGAGDSFVGGFAKGQMEGLDFFSSVNFASHCSAVTIGSVGAQNSMPKLEQIKSYLNGKM